MTARTLLERHDPEFVWIDLVHPTVEELTEIAERYGLHAVSVNDCLDPEHLPKFEAFETHTFIILRACDENADSSAVTVQDLTRKIAIFFSPQFLITIHRKDQPWLSAIHERPTIERSKQPSRNGFVPLLLSQICNAALDTYLSPMERIESRLDAFETKLFAGGLVSSAVFRSELHEIHILKHQVTVYKRLLWRTNDVVQRVIPGAGKAATLFRDVQENAESYHFYADELLDDANTLLNVQLALASHRTGEVMRVLTVFSVFFLPLTFIVGVYGMNFRFMPELEAPWGYPAVLGAMLLVTLLIYRWFRSRGWLRE
ncbi:MAG: CorA family divalent cation transporter [Gemmatimonadales bacterium]